MYKIPAEALPERILCADANELQQILGAAVERYAEVFPGMELLTLSVPAGDAGIQAELLQTAARLLESAQK